MGLAINWGEVEAKEYGDFSIFKHPVGTDGGMSSANSF